MSKLGGLSTFLGSLAIATLPALPGCQESSTPTPVLDRIPGASQKLGFAGDASIYVLKLEGQRFLYADGDCSCALLRLEEREGAEFDSTQLNFKATRVNVSASDGKFFVLDIGSDRFLFVDSNESCALTKMPAER